MAASVSLPSPSPSPTRGDTMATLRPSLSMSTPAPPLPELLQTFQSREDILPLFFHLLWMKQNGQRHSVLEGVQIADTVVVSHSRPIHWYFTSKDGTIKMKTKKNLASRAIIEHMKAPKRVSCSGAVYSLVTRAARGVDETVEVSAGTSGQLQSALTDGRSTGLLQNFVDPKMETAASVHNFVVVANWTPNVLYLEKRVNTLDLRADGPSRGHPLDERATLSEASRFVRVQPLVSSHTTAVLERLCSKIARHVQTLHGVAVSNLVLHVKLDNDNQPWILFCSDMRIMHIDHENRPIAAALSATTSAPPAPSGAARARSAHAAPLKGSRRDARNADQLGGSTNADASSDVTASEVSGSRRRASAGSAAAYVRGGAAARARARGKRHVCTLCQEREEEAGTNFVARQHALFPLAVVDFFKHHPPGTPYSDAAALDTPGQVPRAVLLVAPGITPEQYEVLRDDSEWLDARIALCDACAAGLETITANLHVDEDGAIRVPGTGHALLSSDDTPVPKRARNTTAMHSAQRAAMRKAAAGDSPPPPQQRQPSQHSRQQSVGVGSGSLPPLHPSTRQSSVNDGSRYR